MACMRAPGYASVRRVVDVPPLGVAREAFAMARIDPIVADARAAPVSPALAGPVPEPPAPSTGSARRTWGWAALGAGGGALALGIVAAVIRENNAQIYNDDARCPAADRARVCSAERDTVNLATATAVAGFVATGVFAVSGVVLLSGAPPAAHPLVNAWLAPGTAGVSMRVAF